MKILLTNHALTTAGGTELVVQDLARALRRRGHEIMIYSPRAGRVASVLGGEMFPVVTHPSQLQEKPDIIHGQHHMETMIAVLSLPDTPAIYFCHGMMAWQECPPVHPRILRYVALADLSARRMFIERHLPLEKLTVIPNHVDLTPYLSGSPRVGLKRAAICCRIAPNSDLVAAIRNICEPRGICVDVIWDWSRGTVESADKLFAEYDLIFGTGRTAIEAMSAGCAVSTTDNKLGPLISVENFSARRDFNFSLARWENGFDPEELGRQIDAFRPESHKTFVDMVRTACGIDTGVELVIRAYESTLAGWNGQTEPKAEILAVRDYLCALAPLYDVYDDENKRARAECAWLHKVLEETHSRFAVESQKLSEAHQELARQHASKLVIREKLAASKQEVELRRNQLRILQELLDRSPLLKIAFRNIRKTIRSLK